MGGTWTSTVVYRGRDGSGDGGLDCQSLSKDWERPKRKGLTASRKFRKMRYARSRSDGQQHLLKGVSSMSGRPSVKTRPFPCRPKGDGWEVLKIIEGHCTGYIRCRTKEDAAAIAQFPVFIHRWRCWSDFDDPCDLAELEKTIATLQEHGLIRSVGYRDLLALAARIRTEGR